MNEQYRNKAGLLLPLAMIGAGALAAWAASRVGQQSLTGKVALVTGGSRGLGFALARELAAQGCRLAICARDEDRLEEAADALRNEGAEVLAVGCDVASRSEVERMIRTVTRRYGAIDLLVANAGQIRVAPLENLTVADFEKAMGVMFWGVVYPALAVLPAMRQRGDGHIVAITSIGGKVSVPHLIPYSCAKFAAVGFCEGLRAELKSEGIRVTTVVPGLMRTGSYRNAEFGGQQEKELAWFGAGASLPLSSMDVETAARQIVKGIRKNRGEQVLTVPAKLLALLHGVFPQFVMEALGEVNRLLPDAATQDGKAQGRDVEEELPGWWQWATALGRKAAARYQ